MEDMVKTPLQKFSFINLVVGMAMFGFALISVILSLAGSVGLWFLDMRSAVTDLAGWQIMLMLALAVFAGMLFSFYLADFYVYSKFAAWLEKLGSKKLALVSVLWLLGVILLVYFGLSSYVVYLQRTFWIVSI